MSAKPTDDSEAIERATRLTTETIWHLIEQYGDGGDSAVPAISFTEGEELIKEIGRIIPAENIVSFVFRGILNAKGHERNVTTSNIQDART